MIIKSKSIPFNPRLTSRSKLLRTQGILSEVLFWNAVKNRQIEDYIFTRQKIIGSYIVDFYCHRLKLIIEIDGSSHDKKEEYDKVRDNYFKALELNIIHYTDLEVKYNLGGVIEHLKAWIEEKNTTGNTPS